MWEILAIYGAGVLSGVWIGRRIAEMGRARFEMRGSWDKRKDYRE